MTEVEAPPPSLADSKAGPASLTAFGLSKPGAKSLEDMRALAGTSATVTFEEVVLVNPSTGDGRTIDLEIGEHGLSIRDPAGALLKIIPMEHLFAYGVKPSKVDGFAYVVVQISNDLESFHKTTMRTSPQNANEIVSVIQTLANERATVVKQSPRRASRRSWLGRAFSARRSTDGSTSGEDGSSGAAEPSAPTIAVEQI